ncbi:MAG: hypothetical protein EP338_05780 [Bacteroidetes bacterium]|nr:MAG: hypothetical protein EP338_05780 [Bacteroidota bacterium]
MSKSKHYLILFLALGFSSFLLGQRANNRSKSELGILAGGIYYIGDLNPESHFKNTELTYGAIYRYNPHSRTAFRSSFMYGIVKASDTDANNDFQRNRNLSFESEIFEFSAGFEFNYLPYKTGHDRHRFSPYLFAEIGVFHMNPKTEFNGELIALQDLGTEGQGSGLSSRNFYPKVQFNIPIGLGIKASLSKNICFNLEYVLRKTFTDYLDDVSSYRYPNREELTASSGPLVAELSNRSLDGSSFGQRGNPSTKDWYFSLMAGLSIRLGKPDRCFHH